MLFSHKRDIESAIILFVPAMKPRVKSNSDRALAQQSVTECKSPFKQRRFQWSLVMVNFLSLIGECRVLQQ